MQVDNRTRKSGGGCLIPAIIILIIFIVLAIIGGVLIIGVLQKTNVELEALSTDEVYDIIDDMGYDVDYSDDMCTWEAEDIEYTFAELGKASEAQKSYNDFVEDFESIKANVTTKVTISFKNGKYYKGTQGSDGMYVCIIDDTILIAEYDKSNVKNLDEIIEALGYVLE